MIIEYVGFDWSEARKWRWRYCISFLAKQFSWMNTLCMYYWIFCCHCHDTIKIENERFVLNLYQMDIERIRYSLSRYHRVRLMKIEKHLEYILSEIDVTDKLSNHEKIFATKLNQLNNNFFEDNVANRLSSTDTKEYYLNATNRLKQAQISTKVSYAWHYISKILMYLT